MRHQLVLHRVPKRMRARVVVDHEPMDPALFLAQAQFNDHLDHMVHMGAALIVHHTGVQRYNEESVEKLQKRFDFGARAFARPAYLHSPHLDTEEVCQFMTTFQVNQRFADALETLQRGPKMSPQDADAVVYVLETLLPVVLHDLDTHHELLRLTLHVLSNQRPQDPTASHLIGLDISSRAEEFLVVGELVLRSGALTSVHEAAKLQEHMERLRHRGRYQPPALSTGRSLQRDVEEWRNRPAALTLDDLWFTERCINNESFWARWGTDVTRRIKGSVDVGEMNRLRTVLGTEVFRTSDHIQAQIDAVNVAVTQRRNQLLQGLLESDPLNVVAPFRSDLTEFYVTLLVLRGLMVSDGRTKDYQVWLEQGFTDNRSDAGLDESDIRDAVEGQVRTVLDDIQAKATDTGTAEQALWVNRLVEMSNRIDLGVEDALRRIQANIWTGYIRGLSPQQRLAVAPQKLSDESPDLKLMLTLLSSRWAAVVDMPTQRCPEEVYNRFGKHTEDTRDTEEWVRTTFIPQVQQAIDESPGNFELWDAIQLWQALIANHRINKPYADAIRTLHAQQPWRTLIHDAQSKEFCHMEAVMVCLYCHPSNRASLGEHSGVLQKLFENRAGLIEKCNKPKDTENERSRMKEHIPNVQALIRKIRESVNDDPDQKTPDQTTETHWQTYVVPAIEHSQQSPIDFKQVVTEALKGLVAEWIRPTFERIKFDIGPIIEFHQVVPLSHRFGNLVVRHMTVLADFLGGVATLVGTPELFESTRKRLTESAEERLAQSYAWDMKLQETVNNQEERMKIPVAHNDPKQSPTAPFNLAPKTTHSDMQSALSKCVQDVTEASTRVKTLYGFAIDSVLKKQEAQKAYTLGVLKPLAFTGRTDLCGNVTSNICEIFSSQCETCPDFTPYVVSTAGNLRTARQEGIHEKFTDIQTILGNKHARFQLERILNVMAVLNPTGFVTMAYLVMVKRDATMDPPSISVKRGGDYELLPPGIRVVPVSPIAKLSDDNRTTLRKFLDTILNRSEVRSLTEALFAGNLRSAVTTLFTSDEQIPTSAYDNIRLMKNFPIKKDHPAKLEASETCTALAYNAVPSVS